MAIALSAVAAACGADGELADSSEVVAASSTPSDARVVTAKPSATIRVTVPAGQTIRSSTSSTGATTTATTATTTSSTTAPPASTTTAVPATTTTPPETGSGGAEAAGSPQVVRLHFESQVDDVPVADLTAQALAILNDPRGWSQAGFTFVADDNGPYRVVLAEGSVVDQLCLPLRTFGTVSCQNGPVVGLNADRWRTAVDHWVLGVEVYRGYLVNHEVGHLIGQRHPKPRCPVAGRPAGVMEQQTAGLEGCIGNPWPRDWELDYARQRPVVYAPLPDWGPDPVPTNSES